MKLDKRRNYYMVLDCETATLPCVVNYDGSARQAISIAKPLIYDLGWQIIDRKGNVYARKNFLISEIFSVPSIFDTAYYASKRPLYLEKLEKNEIVLTDWRSATAELVADMEVVSAVGAYNSMFDFKKAIPFTELYINKLYSTEFYQWEKFQTEKCDDIANKRTRESTKQFDPEIFRFRGKSYPLFDLWGLSCEHILNNDDYRHMCETNGWITASGKYYKTSAETAYRFISGNTDFDEAHTALDDAEIESILLVTIMKTRASNLKMGIIYFPFRIIGKVE